MHYYISKNHNRLNGRPFVPEKIGDRICLNPKYSSDVKSNKKAKVLLDSGAFQDRQKKDRLSFSEALQRQLDFEERKRFTSELLVSYDRLVDEAEGAAGRNKKRVHHSTAKKYVKETVDAAQYLVDHRKDLKGRNLLLSCQGVNPTMYAKCVSEILEIAEPCDVIGFGGFCIIGQQRSLADQFFKSLKRALPLMAEKGTERVHFFGVGYFPVLVKANLMCREAGITPSYDTSSYEFNGVLGRVFNPLGVGMNGVFGKEEKHQLYHPAELALLNIRLVKNFWDELNNMPIPSELEASDDD